MRMRHVVAAISLLLSVWTGWATYQFLEAEQCVWAEMDGCATPSDYHWMMIVGFVAQVFAFLATGYFYLLGASFVGFGLPWLFFRERFDDDWVMGLVFVAVPFLCLIPLPRARQRARNIERLVAQGSEAVGTVLTVGDTGVTLNNNPRVRLGFRIEPVDGGPAYEAEKAVLVPRVSIPRPGDRFPVFFDPADPTDWVLGMGTPDAATHPRMRALWERAKGGPAPTLPPPLETAGDVVTALSALNEQHLRGEIDAAEYAKRSAGLLRTSR